MTFTWIQFYLHIKSNTQELPRVRVVFFPAERLEGDFDFERERLVELLVEVLWKITELCPCGVEVAACFGLGFFLGLTVVTRTI